MSTPLALPTALPYGLRDIKMTSFADAQGSILGTDTTDFPNARTLSFSEQEEFEELRGDDRVITTRGRGAMLEWEIEAGGLSLDVWKKVGGGKIIDEGTTPTRSRTYRKCGRNTRPWNFFQGRIISDSGGDVHGKLYRCRLTDELSGEFGDGEFFMTSCKGQGLPLLEDGEDDDILYDIVQHEKSTPLGTPTLPDPTDND